MAKPIGTLGNVDLVWGGNRQTILPAQTGTVIQLVAWAGANNYSTLRTSSGADYVASGSGLLLLSVTAADTNGAGTGGILYALYGDTAVFNSGSAPTNPVYYVSGSTTVTEAFRYGQVVPVTMPFHFLIPSGKYPCFRFVTDAGSAHITALELP